MFSGVDIMVEGTTNTFKDIYDIFSEISKVWDQLSDTQQARISEILGGTRQLQVISSILANFDDAANAYSDAMNSAGVATKANDQYMESVAGHIGQPSGKHMGSYTPRCPICGSPNIRVIGTGSRLLHQSVFGLASSKSLAQRECRNCRYRF